MPTQTAKLVAEFQANLGLSEVDAQRAAFCVLAARRGWSKARTGRYLGVSRARVHQRMLKYQVYAESGQFPELAKVMDMGNRKPKDPDSGETSVSFTPQHWDDPSFVEGMLQRVQA